MNDKLEWAKNELKIILNKSKNMNESLQSEFLIKLYETTLDFIENNMNSDWSESHLLIIKDLVNNLADGIPLTPILDTPDNWIEVNKEEDGIVYQCKRCFDLFKKIYNDGRVLYEYMNRITDISNNNNLPYCFNLIHLILNELEPITMPFVYERIKVNTECCLIEDEYETILVAFYDYTKPYSEKVSVNRYFRDCNDNDPNQIVKYGCWVEISRYEYEELKNSYEIKEV